LKGTGFSPYEKSRDEIGASAPATKPSCSAKFNYTGKPDTFDVAVQYLDLQGGAAKFTLSINGHQVDTLSADDHLPSSRPNGDNSTRHTVPKLTLKPGDTIRIEGTPDNIDSAALDYIELLPRTAD
jgi:hypothetical protein